MDLNEYETFEEEPKPKKKHFPTMKFNFIKKFFKGLLKLWGRVWGSSLLIIVILFLYFTNSFTLLYFNVKIKFERYKIEYTIKRMNEAKEYLLESADNLGCYKEQFERLWNGEDVEFNYCNK